MMKEIDEICRENGIHYTLGGGTAIGAIRHRGFIPWDDDIDLYMTRENWEKFKAAEAAGKFPPNRVIESAETDINYTNTIRRYVTTDTSSVHSHQIISDDAAGHVIDVFVFDPINYSNYRKFFEDMMLYSDLLDETKGYSSRFDVNLRRYPEALRRCENGEKRQVIDELVDSFSHMDDPGWEHYIMEWGVAPFLFPKSIFEGGYIRVPFEDTTVEIVRNYGEYLIWQYGEDWEYIPPHDGREGHDAIFSSRIPYKVVREDYMPFLDAGKIRSAYLRRKVRLLRANPHRRKAEEAALKEKAMACRNDLVARIAAYGVKPFCFEDYFALQLSPEFAGRRDKHSTLRRYSYPVRIPIGEELTIAAVETLMRTGRMAKAKRLIDIYTGDFPENFRTRRRTSERLSELNQEILTTRELTNEVYAASADAESQAEIEALCSRLADACGRYAGSIYLLRLKIHALRLLKASIAAEIEDVEPDELDAGSEEGVVSGRQYMEFLDDEIRDTVYTFECLCPVNSQLQLEADKYIADLDGADDEYYISLYKASNNGCLRLEIADYLESRGVELPEDEEPEHRSGGGVAEEIAAEDEPAEPEDAQTEEDEAESDSDVGDGSQQAAEEKTDLYDMAKAAYRKLARRDDRLKEEAWEIACRTRDRVVLLEKYAGRIDELEKMKDAGDWDALKEEMAPYDEAVMRNLGLGLGLCVHPRLQEIEYAILRHDGRDELAERIDSLVPEQHRKPIAELTI